MFIILLLGKHPVHIHTNHCGPMYEVATLDNATQFPTEDAALVAARKHQITIPYSISPFIHQPGTLNPALN